MKKIFISDLDGSLLTDEKRLTENTIKSIIKLKEQGHRVGIATGRPYPSAFGSIPQLKELFDFGVFNNGANTYDFKDGEIHDQFPLTKEIIIPIIETYRKLGANPILFDGTIMYVDKEDKYTELVKQFVDVRYEDMMPLLQSTHEKIIFSAFGETMDKIEQYAIAHPHPDYRVFKSQEELIEFTDPRINKWVGIEYYLDKYKLKECDVITFGDNDNDIEMIQHATIGIAMANATDAVLKVADRTTLSNEDEGVNAVLKTYIK